ncbi:hypothetical protein Q3G72_020438 [Acer saccharum]|nr:hypothetical protein Q3G72_020438 [Acer saccharum]
MRNGALETISQQRRVAETRPRPDGSIENHEKKKRGGRHIKLLKERGVGAETRIRSLSGIVKGRRAPAFRASYELLLALMR